MSNNDQTNAADARGVSLADIVAVIRRRWLVLALCLLAFPAAAYGFSQMQEKEFHAEAKVLLSDQNLANSLTDTPDPGLRVDRDRIARTQIEIAKLPTIADLTLRSLKIKDIDADQLSANATAGSLGKTDIMVIGVNGGDREQVVKLANEYARQYTLYRARLDTAAINRTLREVKSRLDSLGSDKSSELYEDLTDKSQRLRTLQTLQTSNSIVIRRATDAEQIKPTPGRNAALGLILGLIVGGAMVLIVDSLDSRLRGAEAIAAAIGGPLLGRTPPLARRSAKNSIAMLEDPRGVAAEAYRRVLGGAEFALAVNPVKTIAVVSATDGEGRCDLAANLAVGFARAGRRVVAIDTDFVNPRLSTLFGMWGWSGLSDLAIGRVERAQVCLPVQLNAGDDEPPQQQAANGHGGPAVNGSGAVAPADFGQVGTLTMVPTGSVPPEPGDFIGTDGVGSAIAAIAETCEIVLLDTPAMLRASDALRLARHVEGVIVVVGADALKRDSARAVRRQLDQMHSHLLGVVVTGDAKAEELSALNRLPRGKRRTGAPIPPVAPAVL